MRRGDYEGEKYSGEQTNRSLRDTIQNQDRAAETIIANTKTRPILRQVVLTRVNRLEISTRERSRKKGAERKPSEPLEQDDF